MQALRQQLEKIRPVPAAHHSNKNVFVYKELGTCEFVFVCVDRVKAPLQSPYEGPYRVISRKEKTFAIEIKNQPKVISINRLKPAFVENILDDFEDHVSQPNSSSSNVKVKTKVKENSAAAQAKQCVQFTKSGRRVSRPNRYMVVSVSLSLVGE